MHEKDFGMITVLQISEQDLREAEWLWFPYLPANNVTLLFGRGGIGKSFVSADLAARVSSGREFPHSTDKPPTPQKVLLASAEDDIQVVLGARLVDAGARLENILFTKEPFVLGPAAVKKLREIVKFYGVKFLILDPIVSYTGGKVDMNRMNEVRSVMGALQTMAAELGVTVVVVHHSRKSKEGDDAENTYELAAGSSDFVNASRSTIFIRKGNTGNPVFTHVKSNYAKEGPALEYEIAGGRISWGQVYTEGAPLEHPTRAVEAAQDFLRELLANGPVPSQVVMSQAKAKGINPRTLARAKTGVAGSRPIRQNGKLVWYMMTDEFARTQWGTWKGTQDNAEIHGVAVPEDPQGKVSGAERGQGVHGAVDPGEGAVSGRHDGSVGNGRRGKVPDPRAIYEEFMREKGLAGSGELTDAA